MTHKCLPLFECKWAEAVRNWHTSAVMDPMDGWIGGGWQEGMGLVAPLAP
jgi:hypothetical protein